MKLIDIKEFWYDEVKVTCKELNKDYEAEYIQIKQDKEMVIHYKDGKPEVVIGATIGLFLSLDTWLVYPEKPKTVTLYRYTYRISQEIYQTLWSDTPWKNPLGPSKSVLLKSESKEVIL